MTLTIDLGILLALACAFASNLAFFYKHRGANAVAKVSVRHPLRSAIALYSSRWFALGMLIATASWGLHVAALALAPMSVVQVALAAGVVLIAVMAERMFGFEVGPRQWLGLTMTAVGLATLGITLPSLHGAHSQFSQAAMISFEAGLFGVGGLLIMGPRMGGPTEHRGAHARTAAGCRRRYRSLALLASGAPASPRLPGAASISARCPPHPSSCARGALRPRRSSRRRV